MSFADLAPADNRTSWGRSAGLLSIATIAVSVGNYAFSLVAARLLDPGTFSTFAAAQGLLLVLGTGCMAAVPWAMARYIAIERHTAAPQEAMHFGVLASLGQAAIVGPLAGIVMWITAGPTIGVITAICGMLIALTAASTGFLQGVDRVPTIGWLRVLEVVVRVIGGLLLIVLFARTAGNALWGFALGSAVLLIYGLFLSRKGFPLQRPDRPAALSLLKQSLQLGLIQIVLAMLGAIDGVMAQNSRFDAITAGSYQAAALLGRVPLFVSGAIGLACYTALAAAGSGPAVGHQLRKALLLYGAVTAPLVAACWSVPDTLLRLLIPANYSVAPELLKFSAAAGALMGLIGIITTANQATARFAAAVRILVPSAILQPIALLIAGRAGGAIPFSITLVVIAAVTAALVCWDARRWNVFRLPERWAGWLVLLLLPFAALWIHSPILWMAYLTMTGGLLVFRASRIFTRTAPPTGLRD